MIFAVTVCGGVLILISLTPAVQVSVQMHMQMQDFKN